MYAHLQESHVATHDSLRATMRLFYEQTMDQLQAVWPHCNVSENNRLGLKESNLAASK